MYESGLHVTVSSHPLSSAVSTSTFKKAAINLNITYYKHNITLITQTLDPVVKLDMNTIPV